MERYREENPKYGYKDHSECHFAFHKSRTDWTGIKPGLSRGKAGDEPPDPWHGQRLQIRESKGTVMSSTKVSV